MSNKTPIKSYLNQFKINQSVKPWQNHICSLQSVPNLLGGRRAEGDLKFLILTWGERSVDGPD